MNTPSTKSSIKSRRTKFTVVKLGGSLLDLDDLVERLVAAVADLDAPIVVTGGGPAADRVRQWDERGLVDNNEAHWLAIAAMSFNALQLTVSDARLCLVTSRSEAVTAATRRQVPLLDVLSVLRAEQPVKSGLLPAPESWDVTSDSIAAWLARAWNAELWLLKSVDPGTNPMTHLDDGFAAAVGSLRRLTWLNLRSPAAAPALITLPLVARMTQ